MARQVVWTDDAKENIRAITNYLLEEWNFEVAENFSDKLIASTLQLETMPFLGKKHPDLSAVRQLVISPQNLLYYTVYKDEVIVLNVIDSRLRK
jgi:plasmid stabilization system protein ParE